MPRVIIAGAGGARPDGRRPALRGTATERAAHARLLDIVERRGAGTDLLHRSSGPHDPTRCTHHWFGRAMRGRAPGADGREYRGHASRPDAWPCSDAGPGSVLHEEPDHGDPPRRDRRTTMDGAFGAGG